MNILYDKLPDSVCVGGVEYPVYTDFRRWVQIETLLSENSSAEDIARAIMLCYKVLPKNLSDAVEGIMKFHSGNSAYKKRTVKGHKTPVYSYEHDSEYIYGAFFEKYGIDLCTADLHWLQFRALFRTLGDCRFTKILAYRTIDLANLKNKEQKQIYRKLKHRYSLPQIVDTAENIGELF